MSGISNLPCGGDGALEGFQLYEYHFSTDGDTNYGRTQIATFQGKGFLVMIGSNEVTEVTLETESKKITMNYSSEVQNKDFSLCPSIRQYCFPRSQYTYQSKYLQMEYLIDTDWNTFVDLSKTNTVTATKKYASYFYYEPKNVLTFNEFLKVTFNFSSAYKVNRNIMIVYKPK